MTDETFSLSPVSEQLDVPVHKLRRWCDWHAAHLSDGASPAPGEQRRLTPRDVEVLREVQRLRAMGYQTLAINERLERVTVIDAQASVSPQEAPQGTPAPLVLYNDLAQRMAAVEASQRDSIREQVEQAERRAAAYFAAGVGVALVVVVVVVLLMRL